MAARCGEGASQRSQRALIDWEISEHRAHPEDSNHERDLSTECGRRRTVGGGTKRIVGGVEASPGDWPFLAAILGGPEEVFYCAGVLVADQWVLTASHLSEYEPAVNEVEVPVLNRDLCNQWLEHRDLNGDSGGPLLCKDPDEPSRWYVGGIVSWGIKCAHPRLPGVYAYVPKYISWIQRQIQLYNDDEARSEDM
ncbi:hypothetical protein MSG28_011307 [Choristoneura fumiferana]|uniref:Uncharacterized protein n=1 Tax=Choristoneura fumiferana TaxID=7141 RepID=A0ACC0KR32_CHOFU|nr:hypothetical protein MSG28_011307 [Choristoneura fumiferana]